MIRKVFIITSLLFVVSFFTFRLSGDTSNIELLEAGCTTDDISDDEFYAQPWIGNNAYLEYFLDSIQYDKAIQQNTILYRIPISFWVYRNTDGSGGAPEEELKQMMNDINQYNELNRTGFSFYIRNIHYINRSRHTSLGFFLEGPYMTLTHSDNACVNIHLVDNLEKKLPGMASRSSRGVYHKFSHGIIVKRNSSSTTMTHEVGHFLGLAHTHKGSKKGKCRQEAVNRNRKLKNCLRFGLSCEINGDGLCDTPADPNMNESVDVNCNYYGGYKDKWGDTYKPDVANIMGYPTYRKCRSTFTRGQIAVMLHSAEKQKETGWSANHLRKGKQQLQYNFDLYEPDNTMGMATTINFDTKQLHTFHKVYMGRGKKEVDKDEDWVKFQMTEQGSVEIATSAGEYINPDTEILLYNSAKKQIAGDDNSNDNKYSKVVGANLEPGWYFVQIRKKNMITSPSIGDYVLTVKKI